MFATRIALVLVAAAVGVGGCAATTTAVPDPSLDWQPCVENAGYDCASLAVPIDWSEPGGDTIDIALIRDRADDAERKVGTLVSLPGGPGTSGVDQILRGAGFSEELRARFDIVSLDPRGVSRSHQVQCDAGLVAGRPNLDPDNGGRIDEVHSYTKELADSCRAHTGPLIDHVDAVSVARDVEALRIALGENRINLYSRSYGTMPAQAYAELFPQRLRASLMNSVDDHSLDGTGFLATEARAGQDAFAEFADWCARATECALHGTDVHALYGDLYTVAARGQLPNPNTPDRRLTPLDLSAQVTQRLYRPEWPALAKDLHTLAARPPVDPQLPMRPRSTGTPTPAPQLIFCSDWRFDIPDQTTWQRLWRQQRTNAPTLGLHFAWGAASMCSGWPTPPPNPPHHPQITDGPRLLILNSRHDPSTPHEWAVQVAAQTPRTTLLTYDGWGHGVYDRTACTTNAADRYLLDLELPKTTNCPAA
ncbi:MULTISPECIES: alpha/beta fold hydrolase [unclassified Nocardia]|uniref:alpha/beta fold hydrolase n=1 Tax=unclassified Nocardia TaxID=2637762 RepID=UPI00278BD291|nr:MULTISPECIES: alpha/beta fold hydrolase [unclassified Nocardia]